MSTVTVSTFLGVLVLVTYGGVLVALTLGVLGRIGVAGGALDALRVAVRPAAPWLAFAVAATAMAGSLYFSEVAGFVPCVLCWYQRIAMYPLAIILLIAAIRHDPGSRATRSR